MSEHVAVRCKASTEAAYRSLLDRHILPRMGSVSAAAVEREHVAAMHYAMREMPVRANRAIRVLSTMLRLAEEWGLRPIGRNPCRLVRPYREYRRERFLTDEEFRRLGRVLAESEADGSLSVPAAAAIRLLMLTGCRRNEILNLRWDEVDLDAGELRLRDSKTGPRTMPLPTAAASVLRAIPRSSGNPWVIAGQAPGARLGDINAPWNRVRGRAALADVRLHDLRHSFASRALALGEGLPMIGKLLGHTRVEETARYAHLARDSVKASAARVAASIDVDIVSDDTGLVHDRAG